MSEAQREDMGMAREALELHQNFSNELGKLIHGEELAKTAITLAFLMRRNLILGGAAGGGKSTLAWHAGLLVEETREGHASVVHMVGQHDLPASKIIGADMTDETINIDAEGNETGRQKNIHVIKGAIKRDLGYLVLDELNLFGPLASQSLNPALENRRLEIAGEIIPLPNLRAVVATQNPTDRNSTGVAISERQASRLTMGVMMGDDESLPFDVRDKRLAAIEKYQEDPDKGKPELMEKVTSYAQLDRLYEYAMKTPIDDTHAALMRRFSIVGRDALAGIGINEDTARLHTQVRALAKGLGTLTNASQVVGEAEIRTAVGLVMTGRIVAQKKKTMVQTQSLINDVYAAAA